LFRFRYPAGIFERQKFLQSLYDQLESKDKILVNKRVTSVKHGLTSASVLCADGTEYVGDIVIGTDGIHSHIRQEMQRLADESSPGLMDRDKKCKSETTTD
jgi:2-polyprenyl-6-methoxyphenol hydroxylase-like FAD-dependent oxidoreductase